MNHTLSPVAHGYCEKFCPMHELRKLTRREADPKTPSEPAADPLHLATAQAKRFREIATECNLHLDDLATAFSHVHVEARPAMGSHGTSFWDRTLRRWIIHVDNDDPISQQRASALHELKHLIDHPHRGELYGENFALAEQCAEHFADTVLGLPPAAKPYAAQRVMVTHPDRPIDQGGQP